MKRGLKMAVVLSALLCLTGCGTKVTTAEKPVIVTEHQEEVRQEETEQVSVTEEDALADKKIGISIFRYDDNFMNMFRRELESYLVNQGFQKENINMVDARNDFDRQLDQVNTFIRQGTDLLIINPVDATQADVITDLAVAADIPLIYINSAPAQSEQRRWKQNGWRVTYCGTDLYEAGRYQGEMIADLGSDTLDKNHNGQIDYIMLEGTMGHADTEYRTKYSVKTLRNAGYSLNCLMQESGEWSKEKGYDLTIQALETYGDDVEVILSNNDAMALGAIKAIEESGRIPGEDIYLVGVDALPEAVEDLILGKLTGTVFNDYFSQSHNAVDAAIRYLTGEENDCFIGCHYLKVTQENAMDVLDMVN